MFKRQLKVRKSFMIFMSYFLLGSLAAWWTADRLYYKGPKYQAPETYEATLLFREKCREFKLEDICGQRFSNLVRIDVTDGIWYQTGFNSDNVTIGLAEFSSFSPLTKISIDRQLLVDKVLFDTTVIHELGHVIFYLDHNDEKPAIMNSSISSEQLFDYKYHQLVNEMFKDYADSLK